jgi:hypothetical protein
MANSTPSTPRRRTRLQFSLRLLLFGLTAFAIGFPIWYRWPYREEELRYPAKPDATGQWKQDTSKPPSRRVVRTFRRTWGGGKVQEGPENDYLPDGTLLSVTHYQEGEKHGNHVAYQRYVDPSAPGGVATVLGLTGSYDHGKKDGRWEEKHTDREGVGYRAMRTWRADVLDGPAEISFRGGPTKRMMFVQGRLTELDGRPIDELLGRLGHSRIEDPRIAAELSKQTHLAFVETPLKDAVQYLQDAHDIPIVLDRRVPNVDVPLTANLTGLDLQSAIILLLHDCKLAVDYRYGCVCVTTTQDALNWRDSTGVSDIQPAADSALALAWNEPCALEVVETPLDATLQHLTQNLAIGVDLSGLPSENRTMPVTKNLKGLPLRHVLALILDALNLRAEARGGDTIAILPAEAP